MSLNLHATVETDHVKLVVTRSAQLAAALVPTRSQCRNHWMQPCHVTWPGTRHRTGRVQKSRVQHGQANQIFHSISPDFSLGKYQV